MFITPNAYIYSDNSPMQKDKRKYTGFPGDCSEDQLKALEQFRGIVVAVDGGKVDPRWDEVYLLRFLRARKFNLKETEKMWRDHISWRIKNNIDTISIYYFPEIIQLRKLFPHGYHKYTRNHSPIYIQRLGFASPDEIWKVTTPDRFLAYYNVLYESLFSSIFNDCSQQRLKETGVDGRVTHTCSILDLKDVKLTQASAAYKFVKPAAEMAQNNYPEMLGSMFIINAPFLFTGIWAIVKMWIDDKTREKIHILGSGYKKELLKHVDPANLPDFIDGGQCRCEGGCLGTNPGPWNPIGSEFYPNCLVQYQPKEEEKMAKVEKMEQQVKEEYVQKVQVSEKANDEDAKVDESEVMKESKVKVQKVKLQDEASQAVQSEFSNPPIAEQKPQQPENTSEECAVSPASKEEA